MRPVAPLEFPEKQQAALQRARRLEWFSILYLCTSAAFLYAVMGTSQAMRTSWFEDVLSLLPPVAFLVSARVATMKPSRYFPYGLHGAVSIGYLTASLALLAMGSYLLGEAAVKFFSGERTTIGGFDLFGITIWAGWPMLVALAYTGIPTYFLGRAKLKIAPLIHDKVLYADAEMNRADWMAVAAAAVGVLGSGFGFWWLDPLAAAVVSLDIMRDGARNIRAAVTDLIHEMPKSTVNRKRHDPLPGELMRFIESFDWVEKAEVRMREVGHVFLGEAFVVPKTTRNLVANIHELSEKVRTFHWRVQDLTIMPVDRATMEQEGEETNAKKAGKNSEAT